ncbi:MAG: O-antigen ligase family protein [Chloroflexota bacterium]
MAKRRSSATLERRGAAKPARGGARPKVTVPSVTTANIGHLADAVVEATWLVAALAIPLYFSAVTATGFEADKGVLLRVLASVAGAAWLTGAAAGPRRHVAIRGTDLLFMAGIAMFFSLTLATLLSVDLRLSLFGSLSRGAGLVTYLACAVFFLTVATRLRSRRQLERLITVLIFGSVPATLYGFIQQFGLDPIPTQGDPSILVFPSRSTFGQHVFFGAFLVFVTPLTVARVLQLWMRRDAPYARGSGEEGSLAGLIVIAFVATFFAFLNSGSHRNAVFAVFPAVLAGYVLLALLFEALPDTPSVRRVRLWGYFSLLVLQVVTLGVTGARGAWLGFFTSVPVFAFLLAWWLRRPRIWWSMLAASGAVALFVLVLNIPGGPLQPIRTVHGVSRLANLTESGQAVSSTKGRMDIWGAVGTLVTKNPPIGSAWGGSLRDVVGYGPDTMRLDFEAIFPLKLRRTTFEVWTWDRSHDVYLDYLVQSGLLGIVALLSVIGLFCRRILLALRTADERLAWPLMGIGAAFAGHLADGIFGIEMAVTLLLFWLIVGIAAAAPKLAAAADADEQPLATLRLRPVLYVWATLLLLFGVTALWSDLIEHSTVMAILWLLGTAGGVAAVAWLLLPVHAHVVRVSRDVAARPRRNPRQTAAYAMIGTGLVLALGAQFQFENAAFTELVGLRYLGQMQTQQSVGSLQDTVRSIPYEPFYWHDLGTAYLNLAVLKYQSAEPGLHVSAGDAVAIAPETAILLGRDQLFQLSVDASLKAQQLDPSDPLYIDSVGDTYLRWHHPTQALAAFQHAERLSLDNPKYLAEEARAFLQMHQPQQALAVAGQAIALDPTYWYAHASAALALHALGQRVRARNQATVALFWEPVFWPPPQASELAPIKRLRQTG